MNDREKLLYCYSQVKRYTNDFKPKVALVLGSGLGEFANSIDCV